MSEQYWNPKGSSSIFVRAGLRILQFLFAIIIAILYGLDLTNSTSRNSRAESGWVFAEVAAALSALTCIIRCFVTVTRVMWCLWDWVMVVLWAAQTGVFGVAFISRSPGKEMFLNFTTSVPRMEAAVWISLVNMLLWFASTTLGMVWCCTNRRVTRKTNMANHEDEENKGISGRDSKSSERLEHEKSGEKVKMPRDKSDMEEPFTELEKKFSSEPPKYARFSV